MRTESKEEEIVRKECRCQSQKTRVSSENKRVKSRDQMFIKNSSKVNIKRQIHTKRPIDTRIGCDDEDTVEKNEMR
jgi:hypothetical protein